MALKKRKIIIILSIFVIIISLIFLIVFLFGKSNNKVSSENSASEKLEEGESIAVSNVYNKTLIFPYLWGEEKYFYYFDENKNNFYEINLSDSKEKLLLNISDDYEVQNIDWHPEYGVIIFGYKNNNSKKYKVTKKYYNFQKNLSFNLDEKFYDVIPIGDEKIIYYYFDQGTKKNFISKGDAVNSNWENLIVLKDSSSPLNLKLEKLNDNNLFYSLDGDLYLYNLSNQENKKLCEKTVAISFSSDNKKLVCQTSQKEGKIGLKFLDLEGKTEKIIENNSNTKIFFKDDSSFYLIEGEDKAIEGAQDIFSSYFLIKRVFEYNLETGEKNKLLELDKDYGALYIFSFGKDVYFINYLNLNLYKIDLFNISFWN